MSVRSATTSQTWWAGSIGLGLFVALWQLGSLRYNPVVLPSPLATATALVDLALSGDLLHAATQTTIRALTGFALAALLGVAAGLVAGLQPTIRGILWPVVTVLQGIPPIAWIVLALIWFGVGGGSAVFTVAVITLPFTFVATVEGVRSTDRGLIEMARSFRAPPSIVLFDLYLPGLLSILFPALIAGLAIAWKVAVMAEVLGAAGGIGAGLALARVNLNTARALAWVVATVLLMFGFEHLVLHPLRRWLEPWRSDEGNTPGVPQRVAPANSPRLV